MAFANVRDYLNTFIIVYEKSRFRAFHGNYFYRNWLFK